jgi:hypothetical protein
MRTNLKSNNIKAQNKSFLVDRKQNILVWFNCLELMFGGVKS